MGGGSCEHPLQLRAANVTRNYHHVMPKELVLKAPELGLPLQFSEPGYPPTWKSPAPKVWRHDCKITKSAHYRPDKFLPEVIFDYRYLI